MTSGLELWQGESCAQHYFRQRLWGTLSMAQTLLSDRLCWMRHMKLDPVTGEGVGVLHCNSSSTTLAAAQYTTRTLQYSRAQRVLVGVRCPSAPSESRPAPGKIATPSPPQQNALPACAITATTATITTATATTALTTATTTPPQLPPPPPGSDPPGIKLRAAKALEAVDYFVPGYWVFSKLIQSLSDIGYDNNNLVRSNGGGRGVVWRWWCWWVGGWVLKRLARMGQGVVGREPLRELWCCVQHVRACCGVAAVLVCCHACPDCCAV